MPNIVPSLTVSISGLPKTGKSHLALTWLPPIRIFSFDIGLDPVLAKFPDKAIDVKTYPIPLLDTMKPAKYAKGIIEAFDKDYKEAVEGGEFQTVVIDTATALYEIQRHCRAEELGVQNIMQWQYGEVYARLNGIIFRPRITGVNLVLTHYLREKWIDEKNTGILELDGYKRTEGYVDLVLETRRGINKSLPKGKQNVIITLIKDNRFDLDLNGLEFEMTTYDELIALIVGG